MVVSGDRALVCGYQIVSAIFIWVFRRCVTLKGELLLSSEETNRKSARLELVTKLKMSFFND